MARAVLLSVILLIAGCAADVENADELEIYSAALDFVDECGTNDLTLCLKERALKYIDSLPNELDIGSGFRVKSNSRYSRNSELPSLPLEPRAREEILETVLWNRIADYLSSHTIEFRVPSGAIQEVKRSIEEASIESELEHEGTGRGKGGGGGGKKGGGGDRMKGLMMLFQLKAAILGALALKFVALVAFKALLVAKVALTIASIIALKKLLEHKHHTSTYEVVAAHPHHDDLHFDRSFTQEQQLAYKGYEGAARNQN